MRFLRHIITLTAFLLPFISSAQFFVTGDDPGRLKWYSIETDNFKVIYPEGTDSLARVYAEKIEKFRIPVSLTTGYISGQGDGRKMPVVMHAYNAANGSVAWAPKRMDLFTLPSAYDPEPMPWSTMLSVHESRHVTQMQFGMTRAQKPFTWVFGEMWNILVSLVYPGISNMEGDAVITETAWTSSGRGRTADFLNYYWVAFDNGDFRNWNRWRFVSQVNNAPNYYSLGYLTIGGFRYLYDCPEYMNAAYNLAASRPYSLLAFRRTAEKLTGKKFNDAFKEVCDTMYTLWKADADARKPYIPSEQVSADTRFYTEYKNNTIAGNDIYAIKKGHINTPVLVRIDSTGKETRISSFASDAGRMQWDPSSKRLYWSETSTDERWSLQTKSRIRYIEEGSGRKRTVRNPALLYNPALSDSRISATRYQQNGKSFIEIIDSNTGKTIQSIQAPDSLQLLESVWIGEDIYATAISDNGYGIYRTSDWETILAPQPVKIKDFYVWNDELIFTCDRTGVNELYHLDPSTGNLTQKTSTRYGAEDFQYKGDWLYYSSQALDGKKIYRTPVDSLMNRSVNFSDIHHYHIAEAVTAQEKAIALEKEAETDKKVTVSDPQRYGKFRNAFNLHSWAPVYVNVDNIMNMSFDQIWQAASLGATGIFQNRLSTAVGEIGYSAHKDPYNPAKWRHSGHARFTYSGLYPVIEASVDCNDRAARQFVFEVYQKDGKSSLTINSRELNMPYVQGNLKIYIPFNFSRGGWYRGLIPQLNYRITNDMFNTGAIVHSYDSYLGSFDGNPVFLTYIPGKNHFRHYLTGALRGYTMLNTPNSAVYPKWGVGFEVGASGSLGCADILNHMGYTYLYGYVPGVVSVQGLKLTAMHQLCYRRVGHGQPAV